MTGKGRPAVAGGGGRWRGAADDRRGPDRRGPVAGAVVAALLLVPVCPPPLAAQGLDLIPLAGLYAQLNGLADDVEREGSGTAKLGRRESSLALGLGAELGSGLPISLRGNLLFGTASDVPIRGEGCTDCEVRTSLLVLTGTLVVRPFPGLVLFHPYFFGGGGVKRHGFDDGDLAAAGVDAAIDDEFRGAVEIGAGVALSLGLVEVLFEVHDVISRFEPEEDLGDGKLQNDVFLLLGLRL